jgi:hypothetical protein
MRPEVKKTFYFRADANSLGGFVEEPFQKIVPSQAPSSLPAVGGYVTTRTEAFNLEKIVSCRLAYTRASGRETKKDGPWSMLITSVIEGLNILEVVTAERIVAQLSVEYSKESRLPRVSLTGSHFEKLRIGGCDASPTMNAKLMDTGGEADGPKSTLTQPVFHQTGREQGRRLIKSAEGDASQWVRERFEWMDSEQDANTSVLCSLVDGVDQAIPGKSFGHVVEIPDFGRIFLGELLVHPASIQLSMVRAELGCNVKGQLNAAIVGSGGHTVPP